MSTTIKEMIEWQLANLKNLFVKAKEPKKQPAETLGSYLSSQFIAGDDTPTYPDTRNQARSLSNPYVARSLDLIASTIASMRPVILKDGVEIEDHQFVKAMLTPTSNRYFDGYRFLYQTAYNLQLFEGSFTLIARNKFNEVIELVPMLNSYTTILKDPNGYIAGYSYQKLATGQDSLLTPNDVLYIINPNPYDLHEGLSKIYALEQIIDADRSARDWNQKSFDNGTMLNGVFSVPIGTPAHEVERISKDIRQKIITEKQAIITVRAGEMSYSKVGSTQNETNLVEQIEQSARDVFKSFGIPLALVEGGNVNRATLQAAKTQFMDFKIQAIKMQIENAINAQIIRLFYEDGLVFALKSDTVADRDLAMEETAAYMAYMTYSEMVQRVGWGEVPKSNEPYANMPVPMALSYFAKAGELAAMQAYEVNAPTTPTTPTSSTPIDNVPTVPETPEIDDDNDNGGQMDEENEGTNDVKSLKSLVQLENGKQFFRVDKGKQGFKPFRADSTKWWRLKGGQAQELANG